MCIRDRYYGETRNAHGYDYWTTSEEDEESLNIREQVASGAVDVKKKKKKKRKKLLAPGAGRRTIFRFIGLILLLAIAALAYTVFNYVQISDAAEQRSQEPADAILVLGDAESQNPSNVLQERLDHAFTLFGNDAAPLIITTVANDGGDSTDVGQAGRQHLLDRGVPRNALAQVAEGVDAWDQIAAAAATLEDRNLSSLLIVSDSHHSYRVLEIADALDLDARVSPSLVTPSFTDKAREAVTVSVGRITGFDRIRNITE